MKVKSVILAAGQGTRMHSALPKVLHPILGQPMALYAVQAASAVTQSKPVVVVGHEAERVQEALGDVAQYVLQEQQLGTGHAVQQTEAALRGKADFILVTYGDMPIISAETLQKLVAAQQTHRGPISLLTLRADDPRGFGRIVRSDEGQVLAIVEETQASPEQLAIRELNTGIFCFDAVWLWDALDCIKRSP